MVDKVRVLVVEFVVIGKIVIGVLKINENLVFKCWVYLFLL